MNIALIGNGYWGKKVAPYFSDYFNLSYICTSKTDLSVVYKDKEVDAVFIATPIGTHYRIVKDSLMAGKSVFSEKPLSTDPDSICEISEIASSMGLKIAVDYTNTFSKGVKSAIEQSKSLGKIQYVEMNTKHLGRFLDYNVYWLLASHNLSVLNMIEDIRTFDFSKRDLMYNGDMCTTGSLLFSNSEYIDGTITVSLNYPGKDCTMNIYCEGGTVQFNPCADTKTLLVTRYSKDYGGLPDDLIASENSYSYNERDNLRYAMEYFSKLLRGEEDSNIDTAIAISEILSSI